MKLLSLKKELAFFAVGLVFIASSKVRAEDWIYYTASMGIKRTEATFEDWYALNRLRPLAKTQADTYHFYDQDNMAASSPFGGGIVRVWEKSVSQWPVKSYEEARREIERESEETLKRKISVLDQAWIFPLAVKRATKETQRLFEINCDSREFFILEVNTYDKTGFRMTREVVSDKYLWSPVQPGTIMELLSRILCE